MPPMSRTWSAKPFSTTRRTPDPKAASSSLAAATSRLEGLAPYAPSCFGKRFYALVIYSAIIGFAGSLNSLFLSKQMAKAPMRVRIIGEPRRDLERRLISAVRLQADRAGITMLEVGIFDRSSPNAFAINAGRVQALCSSHFPLEKRIAALEQMV